MRLSDINKAQKDMVYRSFNIDISTNRKSL